LVFEAKENVKIYVCTVDDSKSYNNVGKVYFCLGYAAWEIETAC